MLNCKVQSWRVTRELHWCNHAPAQGIISLRVRQDFCIENAKRRTPSRYCRWTIYLLSLCSFLQRTHPIIFCSRKKGDMSMPEPYWRDADSAKQWLEQRYVGSTEAGSPLYQYLIDLGAKGLKTNWHEIHLTTYELMRWVRASNITGGIRYPSQAEMTVYYPEYNPPTSSSRRGKSRGKGKTKPSKRSEQRYLEGYNKGEEQKGNSDQANDRNPLGQRKTSKVLKEQSSIKGMTKNRRLRREFSPGLDPKTTRQPNARLKSLRPRIGDRKYGSTGKIFLICPTRK